MKVRAGFSFSEPELRSIRASIGRGGKATRRECAVFIDRAVRTAIERAPEAKAPIVRREAPKDERTTFAPPDTETTEGRAALRERIGDVSRRSRARWRGEREEPTA